MGYETWFIYAGTILVFMSTPGPSHLLMLSNAMAHGFKRSMATAAGDLSANTLQMLAAGFGLAGVMMTSRYGFSIVKWAGVAYLIWLGVRTIRNSSRNNTTGLKHPPAQLKKLWFQGFVTSAANPKAVVFFAALFPQFIDPASPLWPQLLILGATYLTIDGCFLAGYGAGASWLSVRLKGTATRWVGRISGSCLIGAAAMLGFKGIQRTTLP